MERVGARREGWREVAREGGRVEACGRVSSWEMVGSPLRLCVRERPL